MTNSSKYLIVNADDFGMSPGVNQGIIEAHERGILTSASLMVRSSAAPEAATLARAYPNLSIGLHLDLGEWAFANGEWHHAYEVVRVEDHNEVADEIERQLGIFRDLMGRGPTHLDSHQHVHRAEPVLSLLAGRAQALGVTLRGNNPQVSYLGSFYGQSNRGHPCPEAISVTAMLRILHGLRPGVTELGCHPGTGADAIGVYRQERAIECQTLCDPAVRATIKEEGIVLCSFLHLCLKRQSI